VLRTLFVTVLGFGGTLVLGLGSSVLAARLLGPAMRGELAAIQLLPLSLVGVASFGFPQALVFHSARTPARAGELLGSSLVACLAVSLPVALLCSFALPRLIGAYSPEVLFAARWYLLGMLPLSIGIGLASAPLVGMKAYVEFNVVRVVPSVVYLLALASAFLVPSAVLVAQLNLAGTFLVVIPFLVWIGRRAIRQPLGASLAGVRELLPYAGTAWLAMLPQLLGVRLDQFFVLARLDAAALGFYSIAVGIGQTIQGLQAASGLFLVPYLASDESDAVEKRRHFGRIVRLMLAGSVVGLALVLAALPWLLPLLFGRAFLPALVPAGLLLAASATSGLNFTFGDGFRGMDRPRLVLWSELVSLATKAGLLGLCSSRLTLPLAAALAFAGPLVALAFNLVAYHWAIEPLGLRWLRAMGPDLALLWSRLSAKLRRVPQA
jgi:O-antigen/teichoic acid export membrane protein